MIIKMNLNNLSCVIIEYNNKNVNGNFVIDVFTYEFVKLGIFLTFVNIYCNTHTAIFYYIYLLKKSALYTSVYIILDFLLLSSLITSPISNTIIPFWFFAVVRAKDINSS